MTFSTTITPENRPAWFASVVILAAVITTDIYEHLVVMRQAALFYKFLLIFQVLIAMSIGFINASNAAGQGNAVDILMNSTGLLILNDMDNIVGALFQIHGDSDKLGKPLEEKVKKRDKIFASILALPHLIIVLTYALWFLGLF